MRVALALETSVDSESPEDARIAVTLRELRALGHEVLTIAPAREGVPAPDEAAVALPRVHFPLDRSLGAPHPRLVRALARFRPHVVHAVSPLSVGAFALAAARALAIPSVASFGAALPARRRVPRFEAATWLLRAAHELADLSLAASQPLRDLLITRGFPAVGVWRAGVDSELFHPNKRTLAVRERLRGGSGADGPVLLCASPLAPHQNRLALGLLLRELPDARLAVAAAGSGLAGSNRSFARLAVEDRAAQFASADLFVAPPSAILPCGLALEVMASGLPIVAPDTPEVRAVVKHEETGLLYDAAEAKSALEPIRRLLASRALAESLGRAARDEALQHTWRCATRRLVGCYELAIERAERRSRRVKLRNFLDA